ncbi:MAG TPA: SMI1/KNR4 family protein [Methylophilaceae bacterium]|nr:SMI1/KNR4 family protein [Methylophilaceae bacterium]
MAAEIEKLVEELKKLKLKLTKERPLPTDDVITMYEEKLGVTFIPEYKYFLKEAGNILWNGKDVLQLTSNMDSPRDLLSNYNEAVQHGMPKDWLPFCEDNGDYYCILKDGSVRFWSHNGKIDEKWVNLEACIRRVWIGGELLSNPNDKAFSTSSD